MPGARIHPHRGSTKVSPFAWLTPPSGVASGAPCTPMGGINVKYGHCPDRFAGAKRYAPLARSALSSPWQHEAGEAAAQHRPFRNALPPGAVIFKVTPVDRSERKTGPAAEQTGGQTAERWSQGASEYPRGRVRGGPLPCTGRNFCGPPMRGVTGARRPGLSPGGAAGPDRGLRGLAMPAGRRSISALGTDLGAVKDGPFLQIR